MARLCRDLRNYNTMFCILVGLHMAPVERLRQTWERLPNKYVKMSRDLAVSNSSLTGFLWQILCSWGSINPLDTWRSNRFLGPLFSPTEMFQQLRNTTYLELLSERVFSSTETIMNCDDCGSFETRARPCNSIIISRPPYQNLAHFFYRQWTTWSKLEVSGI